MDAKPTTIDLSENRSGPIAVWIATGDQMSKLPGRMDNVIVFSHQQGAPASTWNMAAIPDGNNAALLISLIDTLQKYVESAGFGLAGQSQIKPRAPENMKLSEDEAPPTNSGGKRVTIPLPPGTTNAQAEELANQLRAKVGLRPAQPRPE